MPGVGHRVAHSRLRRPLIKGGFKKPHQRNGGHPLSEKPDAADVGGIVRGSDAIEGFHRLYHRLVETHAAVDATAHDRLETHGCQIAFVLDVPALFQLDQAIPNRLRIIIHTLEAAFVQKALVAV